ACPAGRAQASERQLLNHLEGVFGRDSQPEQGALDSRARVTLQMQEAFLQQPEIERAIFVRRAEAMIGRHPDYRIAARHLDQPPADFIDAMKVGTDLFLILTPLFGVVARVGFVKDVPQLVLYAVGAPEVLK